MTEDYETKLEIAKFAYSQIIQAMQQIQSASQYKIDFCWDECIWIDDDFFQYPDMKTNSHCEKCKNETVACVCMDEKE